MKLTNYTKSFRALWIGEIISEFGGAAGGIVNGLLLYELTGSKEWMGALWLVYFLPSLILQGISSPFLNHVIKEKMLKNIQLIRSAAYLLPLIGYLSGTEFGTIAGLVALQCMLGLLQPIYASLSFSLLPDLCEEKELVSANSLLDGTLRLMSFIAPGVTSLLLLVSPLHVIYGLSSFLFLLSFFSLSRIPQTSKPRVPTWSKKFWWSELRAGYSTFFHYPQLLRLTLLSSTVQFAVGATLVLNVPFIRAELNGEAWEYAIFAGAFPVGYALGMILLTKIPKNPKTMYVGLIGGGFSFVLLYVVPSIPLAWGCELLGGLLFPLFNAQSAAIFQTEAPRERLSQLSSVRLLYLRITMPLGILFASSSFLEISTRLSYLIIGMIIVLAGLYFFIHTSVRKESVVLNGNVRRTS
ncbi:MFS transporter [Fictibacillus phosphorivorans]|uniref:MFS transporter n=1 Tax=Fictibacillus phosphorivorans TaxID=1221500 RepID=A0A163SHB1_9BACL|nr:MFS transporter [Fictibacillus phosphorivorans]KZE69088.1 MFS transporter [Fictibacillus phosphorivorans]